MGSIGKLGGGHLMARRPRENNPSWIDEHIPEELATSSLFRFAVKLPDGNTIDVDLLQDIDIDYDRLEQQLEQTPSQFVWYAAILAELKSQVQILERKCKAKRGSLTEVAVTVARETGVKPTADQVKAMIESDDTLNTLEARLVLAQKHASKIHHMVEALRMKSDNLRSLAGFKRQGT